MKSSPMIKAQTSHKKIVDTMVCLQTRLLFYGAALVALTNLSFNKSFMDLLTDPFQKTVVGSALSSIGCTSLVWNVRLVYFCIDVCGQKEMKMNKKVLGERKKEKNCFIQSFL